MVDPLAITKQSLANGAKIPVEVLPDDAAVIHRFAEDLLAEYAAAKRRGRDKVVFILPVGPVGQYEMVAERCNAEGISLTDLVVINMDEYLTRDGRDLIPTDDPLSFRRHMDEHFYGRLRSELAPPSDQRHFPHPQDIAAIPRFNRASRRHRRLLRRYRHHRPCRLQRSARARRGGLARGFCRSADPRCHPFPGKRA